ncbi:MAG: ABC transporter ATP-binding protein [Candidatus Rokubacteria bacterium]|nr:ABC transporter ATP-binding protein [Candidatus Rokubacteria bacterium]MBI2197534.1 ABC transporter ATP-binding protein [Candidatus Rokubacteria bacterium]MBI3107514.1 ABC transporter ATP-binding protein [Candidatus Rokubacteria bacterium]OGL17793.1 MAG: branched-chain amino acid ABC transporter ATP-binding protein [Candidatus Rokubacteria bacterium RIFCSPLOWO2_12_FULL_71_19]HLF49244.1 ABC transporter ATP-binding protein [Methylomirabilota bacterium]
MPLLEIESLDVCYDDLQVLWSVSLQVGEGEIGVLLGPNGSGKSTVMNAISGLVRPRAGAIRFRGERIDRLPTHAVIDRGVAHVLERRRVFPLMSVLDNLLLGGFIPRSRPTRAAELERVQGLFPVLRQRRGQLAGTLSGGEQQMLAIARGLMSRPSLLLVDEPFLGLAPMVARDLLDVFVRLNGEGMTILLVEQNVEMALGMAHRGVVLESGRVAISGSAREVLQSNELRQAFLGVV